MEVHEFRFAVAQKLMGTGIPFQPAGWISAEDVCARRMYASTGYKLTASTHMKSHIPKLLERELKLIKEELSGQWLTVIFDGTTRLGEILAVVVRYCTSDFKLEHRLLAFKTSATHLAGVKLAGALKYTLSRDWNICCFMKT